MKTIDYLKSLKPGEVVGRRGLYYFKRLGLIWDYSPWGYLESVTIYSEPDGDLLYHTFPKGGRAWVAAMPDCGILRRAKRTPLTWDKLRARHGHVWDPIEYEGMRFRARYFDGCFSPYLVKC